MVRTNRLSLRRAADIYGIGKSTINNHVIVMTDNISCPTHFPKGKTERKVDSLNIYYETLCHNKVYMKNCSLSPTYSIPQNQVICTT